MLGRRFFLLIGAGMVVGMFLTIIVRQPSTPSALKSQLVLFCGNGIAEGGEECGEPGLAACEAGWSCNEDCKCECDGQNCGEGPQPACGNSIVEEGEQCDDNGACCEPDCTFSTPDVLCRSKKDACDVEEYCGGNSAFCLADETIPDCSLLAECADGKDNDGDGKIDAAQDFGCTDANDVTEKEDYYDCEDRRFHNGKVIITFDEPGLAPGGFGMVRFTSMGLPLGTPVEPRTRQLTTKGVSFSGDARANVTLGYAGPVSGAQ